MNETLSDLLRQTADAAQSPRVDVEVLVRQAGRQQRRRRLAAVATSTVLIGTMVGGSVLLRDDGRSDPDPAPLVPSPTVVDPNGESPATRERPLTYAEGSTIHVGDRDITANGQLMFVDTTDDGVVFMTDLDRRVWFDDGSGAEVIGESRSLHVGNYPVYTGNPGSLVVWREGIGRTPDLVVYDTSRMAEVARIDDNGALLGVGTQALYLSPDWSNTPGCWIQDERRCPDPNLLRFDVATGRTETITRDAYEAELRGNPRMFEGARGGDSVDAPRVAVAPLGATFTRAGHRLVPTDNSLSHTTGGPVRLRWPGAADTPETAAGFWVTQWLDDDRVVLAGYQDFGDGPEGIGMADSYAASYVDVLVCTLPTGVCELTVPRSADTPYLLTGQRAIF